MEQNTGAAFIGSKTFSTFTSDPSSGMFTDRYRSVFVTFFSWTCFKRRGLFISPLAVRKSALNGFQNRKPNNKNWKVSMLPYQPLQYASFPVLGYSILIVHHSVAKCVSHNDLHLTAQLNNPDRYQIKVCSILFMAFLGIYCCVSTTQSRASSMESMPTECPGYAMSRFSVAQQKET